LEEKREIVSAEATGAKCKITHDRSGKGEARRLTITSITIHNRRTASDLDLGQKKENGKKISDLKN